MMVDATLVIVTYSFQWMHAGISWVTVLGARVRDIVVVEVAVVLLSVAVIVVAVVVVCVTVVVKAHTNPQECLQSSLNEPIPHSLFDTISAQCALFFRSTQLFVVVVVEVVQLNTHPRLRPSECDDVIKRAHVSRSRGLPHREGTDGLSKGGRRNPSVSSSRFLVAKGDFRPRAPFAIECLIACVPLGDQGAFYQRFCGRTGGSLPAVFRQLELWGGLTACRNEVKWSVVP